MLNLLFPKICNGCKNLISSGEEILCAHCRHRLPLLRHHENGNESMKEKFFGRFPIENATCLMQFQKRGISQEILHNLKYKNRQEISFFLGKWLGAELSEIPNYKNIDVVIPVPLHRQKLKKRGYNQVAGFGMEIAKSLDVPYRDDILIKVSKTGSQVFKSRLMRFEVEEIFTAQNLETISGKHILLVDDIVTTGATLENCALQLLKEGNTKLSIATMAMT